NSPLTISGVISGSTATGGITTSANNSGLIIFTGANTYSGPTTLGAGTTQSTLQATDGVGLPAGSLLVLDGAVFQSNNPPANFNRPLSPGFGQNVAWQWVTGATSANGGGFSANGGQLTVNIVGPDADPTQLKWGDGQGDVGSRILGPLKFGSATSNNKVLW